MPSLWSEKAEKNSSSAAFDGRPRLERRRRVGARYRRAPVIEKRLRAWEEAKESLHAPSLFRFEVANALTRTIAAGKIESGDAKVAWQRIVAMEISLHALVDGPSVIAVARKLKRESAYDAAYIVLAQELGAELWTLDGPLSRNAASTDLPVRLIEPG